MLVYIIKFVCSSAEPVHDMWKLQPPQPVDQALLMFINSLKMIKIDKTCWSYDKLCVKDTVLT
jgi:hypothetical protein